MDLNWCGIGHISSHFRFAFASLVLPLGVVGPRRPWFRRNLVLVRRKLVLVRRRLVLVRRKLVLVRSKFVLVSSQVRFGSPQPRFVSSQVRVGFVASSRHFLFAGCVFVSEAAVSKSSVRDTGQDPARQEQWLETLDKTRQGRNNGSRNKKPGFRETNQALTIPSQERFKSI